MQPDAPDERETADGTHSNRRRFLKGVGAATVGAVAVTGTASAQQYQFEGCKRVCGDTDADIAVVATDDGFDCRPITEEVDSEEVPWDWAGYCYEATGDEVIVGAIEESAWKGRQLFETWTCELERNPNACAGEHYESMEQVKYALNDNEDCGGCAGTIVRGDDDGITTTEYEGEPAETTDSETAEETSDDAGTDDESIGGGDDGDEGEDGGGDRVEAVRSFAGVLRTYVNTQFGV